VSGEHRDLERAKLEAEEARHRLIGTLGALQHRLSPRVLMSEAWGGVREKSGELADDAFEAVKARPVAVSGVVAAIALYLARDPIRAAASRLFAGSEDEDLITTRLDASDDNYDLTAPIVARKAEKGAKT